MLPPGHGRRSWRNDHGRDGARADPATVAEGPHGGQTLAAQMMLIAPRFLIRSRIGATLRPVSRADRFPPAGATATAGHHLDDRTNHR
jgi:hypothetical protein